MNTSNDRGRGITSTDETERRRHVSPHHTRENPTENSSIVPDSGRNASSFQCRRRPRSDFEGNEYDAPSSPPEETLRMSPVPSCSSGRVIHDTVRPPAAAAGGGRPKRRRVSVCELPQNASKLTDALVSSTWQDSDKSDNEEGPSNNSVHIVVKPVGGGSYSPITIKGLSTQSTVLDLKSAIYSELRRRAECKDETEVGKISEPEKGLSTDVAVPVDRQRLIYNGRMLNRDGDLLGSDVRMEASSRGEGEIYYVHLAPIPEGKELSRRSSREDQISSTHEERGGRDSSANGMPDEDSGLTAAAGGTVPRNAPVASARQMLDLPTATMRDVYGRPLVGMGFRNDPLLEAWAPSPQFLVGTSMLRPPSLGSINSLTAAASLGDAEVRSSHAARLEAELGHAFGHRMVALPAVSRLYPGGYVVYPEENPYSPFRDPVSVIPRRYPNHFVHDVYHPYARAAGEGGRDGPDSLGSRSRQYDSMATREMSTGHRDATTSLDSGPQQRPRLEVVAQVCHQLESDTDALQPAIRDVLDVVEILARAGPNTSGAVATATSSGLRAASTILDQTARDCAQLSSLLRGLQDALN